jgi:outer membrane immunogenic protein
MNKILKLSAIALLASSTSLLAQSKNFEGVNIALGVSAIGAEVSGNSKSGQNQTNTNSGSIGKIAEIANLDIGYTFSLSNNGAISIGGTYTPGKAKVGNGSFVASTPGSTASDQNVSAQFKDPYSIYVMPTYAISNNSAIFAKISYNHVDLDVTSSGTTTITSKPSDLEGWGYGIGSKTMLDKNLYLQVEVNLNDYDNINGTLSNGNSFNADPKTIAGTVSIGYKF